MTSILSWRWFPCTSKLALLRGAVGGITAEDIDCRRIMRPAGRYGNLPRELDETGKQDTGSHPQKLKAFCGLMARSQTGSTPTIIKSSKPHGGGDFFTAPTAARGPFRQPARGLLLLFLAFLLACWWRNKASARNPKP